MNKQTLSFLKLFLPFAIIITAFCLLVSITVQQSYRQSANDPQIQIAEDIATLISQGANPQNYIPIGKVDISKSLATYILIFDKNGGLIGSSASLDDKTPQIPNGVLASAQKQGETKITWQPKVGVRSATVIVYYKGANPGYVLVGRSLREVEIREDNLTLMIFATYVLTLLATAACIYILGKKK